MSDPLHELKHLAELLRHEREEDYAYYKNQVQALPLSERKAQGFTWHPVRVVKTGFAIGERAFVVVEKTTAPEAPHQFRSGSTVSFYSLQPGAENPELQGVINYIDKHRMKIILSSRDLPDWLNDGQTGVDLVFDERSYLEMAKALDRVIKADKDRLAELRNILLGLRPAAHETVEHPTVIPQLNTAQNEAVNQILAARDVAVVHGPPGTGKTTTLVQAIRLLAQRENCVLVSAPSNTATDLLTERLAAEGLRVVRVGHVSRIDDAVLHHTLEYQLANHPESKIIKKVKLQAAEARRQAQRYKRTFDAEARTRREEHYREARELSAWAIQLEDRLLDQVLNSADVVTCTLVGAAHPVLERMKFRTLVVDEAAQALEPATWVPIAKCSKIVLAGDPLQLPPTVKSLRAQRGGLNVTLIEKCLERLPQVNLLNVQYRMHQAIMDFSNLQFYQGALRADNSVKAHRLDIDDNLPVVFIDTAGCGFEEKVNREQQSRYNPDEFGILREHLYLLLEAHSGMEMPDIALISPYREQVIYMQDAVFEDSRLRDASLDINTIDGFQGQERDVVYISLVRSNSRGEIGFLNDYRRMNVAMTRARKQLVIVGDSATIGNQPFYAALLAYCESVGGYRSAWEYLQ